jgi:hypothetical protein
MLETITTTIPPLQGWPCPQCGGRGKNADGMFSIGTQADGSTVMQSRPCSDCFLCKGSGRVKVTPCERFARKADA